MADASPFFMGDESGAFEYAQMFVDGGEGNAKIGGELADRSFTAGEAEEHATAGGIAEGEKGMVERLPIIVSHVAKY